MARGLRIILHAGRCPRVHLHRVVRPYAAESLATARHHSHPNAAKTITFKTAAHQNVLPRMAANPCDNANTPAGSRKCENGMPSRGCQLRGGRSKPRAHANSRTSSSCDAMAFALLVMIHAGRTSAISGSRPWTFHRDRFYRESAASLSSLECSRMNRRVSSAFFQRRSDT